MPFLMPHSTWRVEKGANPLRQMSNSGQLKINYRPYRIALSDCDAYTHTPADIFI